MNLENLTPADAPWRTSKLFFKADVPGQAELRQAMRWVAEHFTGGAALAVVITWAFLVASHGGDDQGDGQ
jgi:hypothetical protein